MISINKKPIHSFTYFHQIDCFSSKIVNLLNMSFRMRQLSGFSCHNILRNSHCDNYWHPGKDILRTQLIPDDRSLAMYVSTVNVEHGKMVEECDCLLRYYPSQFKLELTFKIMAIFGVLLYIKVISSKIEWDCCTFWYNCESATDIRLHVWQTVKYLYLPDRRNGIPKF